MKVEISWIISADKALKSDHIKIVKQPTNERPYYHYPSVYKGYISSFGASIVQSGLVAAAAFFERQDADTDEERCAVVRAVIEVLKEQGKLPENTTTLSVYALQNKSDRRLLKNIDKAIAALKLAIRQYEGIKEKDKEEKNDKKNDKKPEISRKDAPAITEEEFSQKYIYHPDDRCPNIGWLFYRDYYRNFTHIQTNISVIGSRENKGTNMELMYKKQNEYICRSSFHNLNKETQKLLEALPRSTTKLHFRTTYPGLLIGSGLSHGTGTDNDIKLGFQFDYTTGLPYIPGSSIKGVLRSMFPLIKPKEYQKKEESIYNQRRIEYIREKMNEIDKKNNNRIGDTYSDNQIIILTKAIFEDPSFNGLNGNIKKRDVFMDALIIQSEHKEEFFIGDDFITCHKHPLQNPIPLQFLKVLPKVTFCFPFDLHDSYIEDKVFNKNMKEILFRYILADIGIGAKTNVGYGQLEFIPQRKTTF